MRINFHNVSFESASGNVAETKVINGVLAAKISDSNEFIEFIACDDGWWWAGPSDYSIRIYGYDILVSKGNGIGVNPVLYKRLLSDGKNHV